MEKNCNSCSAFRERVDGEIKQIKLTIENNFKTLDNKIDSKIELFAKNVQSSTTEILQELKLYKQENTHDREMHNQIIETTIKNLATEMSAEIKKVAVGLKEINEKHANWRHFAKWCIVLLVTSPVVEAFIHHYFPKF